MATPTIFISYRRDDSGGQAGRLFDRLVQRFGDAAVFRDVDDIAAGEDFVDAVQQRVASCSVLLVVIGRQWASITDASGQPRLSRSTDLVRHEVAGALQRGIRVIPVLVQGASMPDAASLPEDLRALSRRNAVEVRDTRFDSDVEALMAQLGGTAAAPSPPSRRRIALIAGLAALAVIAVTAWYWQSRVAPERARASLIAEGVTVDVDHFIAAAMAGDASRVRRFLTAGMAPDVTDARGDTALGWAASQGHMELVRMLISAGAQPDTALSWVCDDSQRPMFDYLMSLSPSKAALDVAITAAGRDGSVYAIDRLVAAGADPNAARGDALMLAASSGHLAALQALLKHGATPKIARTENGWTVLHMAARNDRADGAEMVRALLAAGADPNASSRDLLHPYPTPLLAAIAAGNADSARVLIEHGADVHARSRQIPQSTGRTALMLAASTGLVDVARLLIERGAQVDARAGESGVLIDAACQDDPALLDLLLAHGASQDVRDGYGRSPLMLAASCLKPDAVRRLLQAGAVPDLQLDDGRTALMLTVQSWRDPRNGELDAALAVVRLLLDAHGRRDLREAGGRTAADLARAADNNRLAALL